MHEFISKGFVQGIEAVCHDYSYYRPQRSCGKVIFSQAPVILSTGETCVAGGHMCGRGRAWQGGCAWQGGMCGRVGMCGRGHVWQGVHGRRGMCGRGHAWQGGGCALWGTCMAGDMHGRGHAWQGVYGRVECVWQGHAWQGCAWQGGVCGRGHAWQGCVHGRESMHDRGACMAGGVHGRGACMAGGVHSRRDGHCSRWYASYWNAFLFLQWNLFGCFRKYSREKFLCGGNHSSMKLESWILELEELAVVLINMLLETTSWLGDKRGLIITHTDWGWLLMVTNDA